MSAASLTNLIGWLAFALLAALIALPYVLRRIPPRVPTSGAIMPTFLERLALHYWLGFILAALAFAHTWESMRAPAIRSTPGMGLWLATVALVLSAV